MFPAYGGGRGGRHGPGRGGHGHKQGWNAPDGPPNAGYMIDRGGGGDGYGYGGREGHHQRGGYDHRGGGRAPHHGNRNRERGYQEAVVNIESSDDDNAVQDAVKGGRSRHDNKRKRSRSKSPSRSHSNKKKKKRSRSRSPNRHQHHRHDRHSSQHQGGGRDRDNRRQEQQEGRWDRQGYQNQQQDYYGHGRLGGPGPSGWNGPPPNLMHMNPWSLDNNPFDQQMYNGPGPHRGQERERGGYRDSRRDYDERVSRDGRNRGYDDRGNRDRRGGYDYDDRQSRGRNSFDDQEQRRLEMSQSYPKKVFLEEVNLNSEFAFRLDTNANPGQVNYRSIAMSQKSSYEGGVGKGIFGASEEEISQVYSKFHTFRCKLPDNITESDESSDDESEEKAATRKESFAKDYISLDKDDEDTRGNRRDRDRMDTSTDFDSYSFERKDGEMSIKERIEYYNKEVRNQPHNISLWKEFVQFQDKMFEESEHIFDQEEQQGGTGGKRKRKSNRKALLEKKISILEKALESNPKNLQLHLLRLDYLLELYKPRHVLTEWKKLVTQHQQSAPFWIEYLLFSASQLMIYSSSSTVNVFDTCFQKFRLMMNPQYPEFQRPPKFPLFISDITFGLSLLMKNSGFMERAIALHQAQLEFDFNCPKELFKDETLINWKDESDIFCTFWDAGTPRFGEAGAKGWSQYVKDPPTDKVSIAVSDKFISDFEDDTFETLNEELKDQGENNNDNFLVRNKHRPNIWLNMESCRSKLYWLPWRSTCSDVEDCEDAQRVVLASDISNFICPVPSNASFITDFDTHAVHFRHIVNLLMTLREDFTPHTQTIDLVCSPFRSVSLTESSSLFSEIYYWRRLADLYVGINNSEPASKAHHVFAPEGFKILDLVSPNLTTASLLRPALFNLTLKGVQINQEGDQDLDEKRLAVLRENDVKFMEMFHQVMTSALEHLEPEFCCVLFEMLLRFEQKRTCTQSGDIKQRIKFAKNLMKHEKIRNSIGGYREIAMLEYFGGGNTQKAIELLTKTINVTGKSLNLEEWDQVDWDKDWKSVVDLISLYRQLSELCLEQGSIDAGNNDSKAFYTLVQLGNCFQPVDYKCVESNEDGCWKPKTNILLKATRAFEKIMSLLLPSFSLNKMEETEDKAVVAEPMVDSDLYGKWDGDKCVEFLLQQRNFIVEWTQCYALFQFFSKDFDAANQVFENVLKRISSEPLSRRDSYNADLIRIHIREQLYISWCNLAARCLIKDPLMNSKFRSILGKALEEFPSSPPLLLLFTDVENQTSVAGRLWRLMMANMKQDSEKIITHWAPLIMGIGLARKIEELEHDEEVGLPCFGLGGPAVPQDTIFYKLDSMISVAEQHPGARHCPLLWRVHLKLLALRAREGKDVQRAKATFYEAIRHCPSSKAIYLDGITYFPDLLKEVHDLMAEKQLLIRLPIEELDVLLEMDEDTVNNKDEQNDDEDDEGENDEIPENSGKNNDDFKARRKSRESKSEGELGDSD